MPASRHSLRRRRDQRIIPSIGHAPIQMTTTPGDHRYGALRPDLIELCHQHRVGPVERDRHERQWSGQTCVEGGRVRWFDVRGHRSAQRIRHRHRLTCRVDDSAEVGLSRVWDRRRLGSTRRVIRNRRPRCGLGRSGRGTGLRGARSRWADGSSGDPIGHRDSDRCRRRRGRRGVAAVGGHDALGPSSKPRCLTAHRCRERQVGTARGWADPLSRKLTLPLLSDTLTVAFRVTVAPAGRDRGP